MRGRLSPLHIQSNLLYLDTDYIAGRFEAQTGDSPQTLITKTEGKKAGATLPSIFSAEVSAGETRAFPFSTLEMLRRVLPTLEEVPTLNPNAFTPGMKSRYGWVEGKLTTVSGRSIRRHNGKEEVTAQSSLFVITTEDRKVRLALLTTPEYFSSGLAALPGLQETFLKELSVPARAFVRVFAGRTFVQDHWVAVPLLMMDPHQDQ